MTTNIDKYHLATGPKKWILWLVVSITVLVAITLLYLKLAHRRRSIEKLLNEAELATQKAAQMRYDVLREKDNSKLAVLLEQTHALQKSADAKHAEIIKNEKEYVEELKQVKALESWKDLDAYNKKSRS